MAARFCIYSTDANPPTVPDSAGTLVVLDDPPWAGDYDNQGDAPARGSVHRTLGGIVVQDFGTMDCDRMIKIASTDALRDNTTAAIKALYIQKGVQWYFHDGYECFKVQFSRNPPGFRSWRNFKFSEAGRNFNTYEINFIVIEKVA